MDVSSRKKQRFVYVRQIEASKIIDRKKRSVFLKTRSANKKDDFGRIK